MPDPRNPRVPALRRWGLRLLLVASALPLLLSVIAVAMQWARSPADGVGEAAKQAMRVGLGVPRFGWVLVAGKHWRIAEPAGLDPEQTDAAEGGGGPCPAGMVHARGRFKLDPSGVESSSRIEAMQNETCSVWISRTFPERCATFDRERWLVASRDLPTRAIDVCVDRFEHPNRAGAYPTAVVTFREAEAACKVSHKRLCTESEWTFACEGEEAWPFPNGYVRDPSDVQAAALGCVLDRPWRAWDERAFADRTGEVARAEMDRLWQGEPSGTHPACKSPFGVYDLAGNVDEWTASVRKEGLPSILKGGYWGPVRGRCRPSTRVHGDSYVGYQQGFRCCADVAASAAAPVPSPAATGAPPTPPPSAAAAPSAAASSTPAPADADELAALSVRGPFRNCAAAPRRPVERDRSRSTLATLAGALALGLLSRRRRRR